MQRWKVIVAALADARPTAEALAAALDGRVEAHRTIGASAVELESLDESAARSSDAVVLVADRPGLADGLVQLVEHLEELGRSVLVHVTDAIDEAERSSLDHRLHHAMLTQPGDDEVRVAARLGGLLQRQPEVDRLRRDLLIAERSHGGLSGEMHRLHEELQLAAMMQREFLPRELPEVHGISFAALWRPSNYVSGDIYGVKRLDADRIGFFLVDCVGHGVPAALMTMILCRALESATAIDPLARREGDPPVEVRDPADVLTSVNRDLIARRGGSTRFATGLYGVIDCRTRMLRLASGGHPPPFLLRADGGVEEVEADGGLLGVFDEMEFHAVETELRAGDRLIAFTDGFEQAFPRSDAEADRKLPTDTYRHEFARLIECPDPPAMVRRIAERLDGQSGSLHQIDDLTLLCMQAFPLGAATDGSGAAASRDVTPEPAPAP